MRGLWLNAVKLCRHNLNRAFFLLCAMLNHKAGYGVKKFNNFVNMPV